jgi:DNA-binding response OmpR family regulator
VDDEPAVRALLVDILAALGHRALEYEGGELALRAYQPGRFDLVLTDVGMPGIDGWQLSQSIRDVDASVTIAFVTGWGEEVDSERVRRAGADAIVSKPFEIEDLARVTRIVADRAMRRAA